MNSMCNIYIYMYMYIYCRDTVRAKAWLEDVSESRSEEKQQ